MHTVGRCPSQAWPLGFFHSQLCPLHAPSGSSNRAVLIMSAAATPSRSVQPASMNGEPAPLRVTFTLIDLRP